MDEGRPPQECGAGEDEEAPSLLKTSNLQTLKPVDELKVAHEQMLNLTEQLTEENEALKSKRSSVLSEVEKDTSILVNLINDQRAHQQKIEEEHQLALDKFSQDMHEKSMIIEALLATIQELRSKKEDLELQLEKTMVSSEPPVDQPKAEDLTNTHVEFSVEEVEEEEERKAEPSLDVQNKSWWRRQKEKMVKGMATLCLCFRRKRTSKSSVITRSIEVQPVNFDV